MEFTAIMATAVSTAAVRLGYRGVTRGEQSVDAAAVAELLVLVGLGADLT